MGFQLGLAMLLLAANPCCPPEGGVRSLADAEEQSTYYTYEIVARYPHDPAAFTQGLHYHRDCVTGECKDVLFESTGLNGRSSVRQVDLTSGRVVTHMPLEHQHFGEGAALLHGRLYQVTWQTDLGFVYDAGTLQQVGTFHTGLPDGWGLTTDGHRLIASDGSDKLTWLDPHSMRHVRSVRVHHGDRFVRNLNELEWVHGEVWANVWQTDCIARVDPHSGQVRSWILLHGLARKLREEARAARSHVSMDVLNGIAFDAESGRVFVTGKLWPSIFEIRVKAVPPEQAAEAEAQSHSCFF